MPTVDQGQYTYLRYPPNNNPVTDVYSTDMTCNVNGLAGSATGTVTVPQGATLTFEWHQHDQRTGEDAISGGHKGSVQVYVAKAPSTAASFNGQGAVWTKIYSSGLLNASTQQWATDVVNANGGELLILCELLGLISRKANTVLLFPAPSLLESTSSAPRLYVVRDLACPFKK
ncbi:hypothetical protein H0H87_003124 [Tephrocybe sp. NHM501043]|nr:hypothetical protein H0H87_003124 [Tephrocybe sp. NHM501043]